MWNKITLRKYLNIVEYLKLSEDERRIPIYAELTDTPRDEVEKMPLIPFFKAYNKATEFMLDPLPKEWNKPVIIEGVEYKPKLTYKEWTAADFVNFQNLAKDPSNIAVLMAVMLKKDKGEVLNEAQVLDRAEYFLDHMTIAQAYPFTLFFSLVMNKFVRTIPSSLKEVAQPMTLPHAGIGT